MKKKPLELIIIIIILVIIVIALGLTLVSKTNPLDSITRMYEHTYPDSVLSIQMLKEENARTLAQQINTYCPGFNLEEYYLAQIDNPVTQKTILYVINPASGRTECVIDRSTDINASKAALSQNLIATINRESVYMQEVMAIYNNIPANMRTNTSLQEALDQVINNKLLLQDAVGKGIKIREGAVDDSINAFLSNNGLTLMQLEQNLVNAGSSIEIFRNNVKNNLLLQAEINEITKDVETPSEAVIKAYHEENKQSFITIPKATTRQLLIYANETNQAEKLEIIKAIADQLNENNFCDLVEEHSEDLISIPRCGLYDFQQGQLLPEYEEIVFNSEPGSTKIIQTTLGYHIVKIINITYPRQLSLEEVKESISNLIMLRSKQAVLDQYIQKLRAEAEIVSYME